MPKPTSQPTLTLCNIFETIDDIIGIRDLGKVIQDYYFDIEDIGDKIDEAIAAGDQQQADYYRWLPNELLRDKAEPGEIPFDIYVNEPYRRYGQYI